MQTEKEVRASSTMTVEGLPFPSPGDLPNPGIKPRSPALQTDSLPAEPPVKPRIIYPKSKNKQTNKKNSLFLHLDLTA